MKTVIVRRGVQNSMSLSNVFPASYLPLCVIHHGRFTKDSVVNRKASIHSQFVHDSCSSFSLDSIKVPQETEA